MCANNNPITPPMVFVMISVISDAPIDMTYCVVSKNKLNKTTTSAFVPNFIFSKVFDRRNPKGIKTAKFIKASKMGTSPGSTSS